MLDKKVLLCFYSTAVKILINLSFQYNIIKSNRQNKKKTFCNFQNKYKIRSTSHSKSSV